MIRICSWCCVLLGITKQTPICAVTHGMCFDCIDQYTMEELGATFWPPKDNWEHLWIDYGGEG